MANRPVSIAGRKAPTSGKSWGTRPTAVRMCPARQSRSRSQRRTGAHSAGATARTDRRRAGAAIDLSAVAWVGTDGSGGDGEPAGRSGRHREIRLDHVLPDDVPAVEPLRGG